MGLEDMLERRLNEAAEAEIEKRKNTKRTNPHKKKSDSDLRCEYFALTWTYEQTANPDVKEVCECAGNKIAAELTRRGVKVFRPWGTDPACKIESADPEACEQFKDEISDMLTKQAEKAVNGGRKCRN